MRKIIWCHLGLLLLDPAAPSYGRVQNPSTKYRSTRPPTRIVSTRIRRAGINAANAAGQGRGRHGGGSTMLELTKRLVTPSRRSDVQPFMVMDVMAAAARLEA